MGSFLQFHSYHTSLYDIGTSRLLPVHVFFTFRTFSVIWTAITVILGIVTRKKIFFIQFTNWMALLSLAYMVLSWAVTYRFIRVRSPPPSDTAQSLRDQPRCNLLQRAAPLPLSVVGVGLFPDRVVC